MTDNSSRNVQILDIIITKMRESTLIKELDTFFDDLDKGANHCRYVNIIVIGA